jgi:hypothetical protein
MPLMYPLEPPPTAAFRWYDGCLVGLLSLPSLLVMYGSSMIALETIIDMTDPFSQLINLLLCSIPPSWVVGVPVGRAVRLWYRRVVAHDETPINLWRYLWIWQAAAWVTLVPICGLCWAILVVLLEPS